MAELRAVIMNASGRTYPSQVDAAQLVGRELVKIDDRPEMQPPPLSEEQREKAARTAAFLDAHNQRMTNQGDRG